jgi:hypothetical protein
MGARNATKRLLSAFHAKKDSGSTMITCVTVMTGTILRPKPLNAWHVVLNVGHAQDLYKHNVRHVTKNLNCRTSMKRHLLVRVSVESTFMKIIY